jgi:hypothetical protein
MPNRKPRLNLSKRRKARFCPPRRVNPPKSNNQRKPRNQRASPKKRRKIKRSLLKKYKKEKLNKLIMKSKRNKK